ncbi:MAG TPA: hypothetical protein VHV77_12485 [Pirellulales bacterium]|jgi:DNA/RNA endonuclease YhcR with UshA esterase domain|nr:hypothetical protein [Pirellulales bacterium]
MQMLMRSLLGLSVVVGVGLRDVRADDEPKIIQASEAREYLNKKCIVEMTVVSASKLGKNGPCFLNSAKDGRHKDTFYAIMFGNALAAYREMDVENPAEHFLNKTIRVTGTVVAYKEQVQIRVDDPDQIAIVEKAPEK